MYYLDNAQQTQKDTAAKLPNLSIDAQTGSESPTLSVYLFFGFFLTSSYSIAQV
jgi:hypothetical protein